ncbi:polyhomeotic-like protein 1 [Dinothrombium tinctorium]|uniref:Polyhomeotic-like protein 1 n=1 Tax=Dinothrombium tinctorium TaxID=1965070 RepID=A0A3S3QP42_9ACAR|nr:polyhomeotic-like protein 1 [Dinothrombium tinctorium]
MDACSASVANGETPPPQTPQPQQPLQQPVVASSTPATSTNEQAAAVPTASQPQPQQPPPSQQPQQTSQSVATPLPSPSSLTSSPICSSTRVPSHISSPVTTTSLIHSPSHSPMGPPPTPNTSIGSTSQTSISQTHVQVPVSSQVSQNSAQSAQQQAQHATHMQNLASGMSVSVSQIPQVQVIQQQPTTYHLQQVYHPSGQQMFLQPGNLTIQNMPAFQSTSTGLQLQLPAHTAAQMPISSVNNKAPIMSKGLALSSISSNIGTHQTQMISSLKTGLNAAGTQMIKPVLPSHQFAANSHQIVISPYGTVLPQPQQTILPANKTMLEAQKGKGFMLSHNATIQPKSPILPTTAMASQFKAQLSANQLITQASPATIMANQAQILSSFPALPQGITWAAAPQSIMGQNSSPIFIRGGQPDIGFIQTTTPQIQTVSGNSIQMVNPNGGTMQVVQTNQTSSTGTAIPHSFITTTSTAGHVNTTTTTQSIPTPSQHPPIAPAPVTQAPAIRPKPLRPANSVGTQTTPSASQQKSSTDATLLRPIAAKTKVQTGSKSTSTVQTTSAKVSANVVSTQTVSSQSTLSETNHIPPLPPPPPPPPPPLPPSATPAAQVPSPSPQQQQQQQPKPVNDASLLKSGVMKGKQAVGQKSSTAAQTAISKTTTNVAVNTLTTSQQQTNIPVSQPVSQSTSSMTTPSQTLSSTQSLLSSHPSSQQEETQSQACQNSTKVVPKEKPVTQVPHQLSQTKPKVEKKDASTEQDTELLGLCGLDLLKAPQKAIVKPQVLTHVIDGYIIQESPNPFPVNGKYNEVVAETPNKSDEASFVSNINNVVTTNGIEPKHKLPIDVIKCENCDKTVPKSKSKTKKGKRFCSVSCGKHYQNKSTKLNLFNPVRSSLTEFDLSSIENSSISAMETDSPIETNSCETHDDRKRLKSKRLHNSQSPLDSIHNKTEAGPSKIDFSDTNGDSVPATTEIFSNGSGDDPANLSSIAGVYIPTGGKNPIKWSVQDVYDFVKNLPGCQEYADEFRSQEIDGQALMLLKEDHLMSAMSMKLGPALKICSKINALREKADSAKPV